jgi:hypothetical protein
MSNKSVGLNLSFKGFDFNNADTQFVTRQFAGSRSSNIVKLADKLRWWGAERCANPLLAVDYNIEVTKVDGSMVSSMERFIVHKVERVDCDHRDVLSAALYTAYAQDHSDATMVDSQLAVRIFDKSIQDVRDAQLLPSEYISAFFSLRSAVTDAAALTAHAFIRDRSITFVIQGLDQPTQTFKVNMEFTRNLTEYVPGGQFYESVAVPA